MKLYDRDRRHVVRYFIGTEYRVFRSYRSFRSAKRWIAEHHGAEAAATAVSWGWQ